METQMQLAELDKFGDTECAVYRDRAGEYYFTREQIGQALGYSDPRNAITVIHKRHKERLDKYSVVTPIFKSGGCQTDIPTLIERFEMGPSVGCQTDTPHSDDGVFHPEYGGTQETTLYSRKGVMEICRWSRQPLADAFIDWVWEVTDRLITGTAVMVSASEVPAVPAGSEELLSNLERLDNRVSDGFDILGDGLLEMGGGISQLNKEAEKAGKNLVKVGKFLVHMDEVLSRVDSNLDRLDKVLSKLGSRTDKMLSLLDDSVTRLDEKVSSINSKVSDIQTVTGYSNYYLRSQMRSGYDERWKEIQGPRLKAAAEYLGMESKLLLSEIYQEMEQRYGVRLNDFVNDYKRQKRVATCSTLSVISFSATLREKFDTILSDVLDICGIEMPSMPSRSRLMEMALSAAAERQSDQ